jgi:menaquinone-dependent protoporphyrinogen oxidase
MSPSPFQPIGPAHYSPLQKESESSNQPALRVGVFFATREAHTKRIAEHIASSLRAHGFDVDVLDVRRTLPFSPADYAGAILAASVHSGNHEPEMVKFVKRHRAELERIATAFLSVTLSEAGAERIEASPAEHAQFVRDVNLMLDRFFQQTKWHPTRVKPVAGALLYTRYNFLLRLIMKRIARKAGSGTDTSRDYEYTDWAGLDHFIEEFEEAIRSAAASKAHGGLAKETTPGSGLAAGAI